MCYPDQWRARLLEAVERDGRPRAEIERQAKISADYLRITIDGANNPTMATMHAICKALGIDLAWLMQDPAHDPIRLDIAKILHRLPEDQLGRALAIMDAFADPEAPPTPDQKRGSVDG